MGIPAITKPQRDSDLGGEFLLFKQASGTIMTRAGGELLIVCNESFQIHGVCVLARASTSSGSSCLFLAPHLGQFPRLLLLF